MPLSHLTGDLTSLDPNHDAFVIVQQVNCQGVMGAGLAKALKNAYDNHRYSQPQIQHDYKDYINRFNHIHPHATTKDLLGHVSTSKVGPKAYVANVFGQDHYGRHGHYTDENKLNVGLSKLFRQMAKHPEVPFYIPDGIGSGLAGGDRQLIQDNIKKLSHQFPDVDVRIVAMGPQKLKQNPQGREKDPDDGLTM